MKKPATKAAGSRMFFAVCGAIGAAAPISP